MKFLFLFCIFYLNSTVSIICKNRLDRDSININFYNISLFKSHNETDVKIPLGNKIFKLADVSLRSLPFRIYVSSDSIFSPFSSYLVMVFSDSSFTVTQLDYSIKDSFYTAEFDYQDSFEKIQLLFLIKYEPKPKFVYYKGNINKSIQSIRTGTIVPNFKLKNLDGSELDFNSLLGNIIVVNWWSPWCKPCIEEIPFLNELYERYKFYDKVKFLAITNESSDITNQKNAFFFTHYSISNFLFGYSFPRNMIIDKSGIIIFDHIGASNDVIKSIDSILQLNVNDVTH